MANGHRPKGRQALASAGANELAPDDVDRMVAILDRMLDLAVSLNWSADRKEFLALQEQLADITGLPRSAPLENLSLGERQ